MIINQANLQTMLVGFSVAFNKAFQAVEPQYQKIATVVPSSTKSQEYKWLGSMPALRKWVGERQIQNLEAYSYAIKNEKFEGTVGVAQDDIEDDTIGVYPILMEQLGQSAAIFPDELCFGLLKDGFKNLCYDGKSFFGEHKVGKTTISNKGNKELTAESFSEAREKMMALKDENGKTLKIMPNLLVIPPQLETVAKKILLADFIEGSSNVNKNAAEILVAHELSDNPKQWFLLDTKKPIKPIIYQERKKPTFVSLNKPTDSNMFMNGQALYGVDTRCNAGYGFWQMAFGSTGEVISISGVTNENTSAGE